MACMQRFTAGEEEGWYTHTHVLSSLVGRVSACALRCSCVWWSVPVDVGRATTKKETSAWDGGDDHAGTYAGIPTITHTQRTRTPAREVWGRAPKRQRVNTRVPYFLLRKEPGTLRVTSITHTRSVSLCV